MKLVSAKCPNCGADLKLDTEKTSVECEYCKQNIMVEEAVERYKIEVSGTISIDGIVSDSELISSANDLLEMKEFLKAKRKFQEFSEKCPNDYQGWLGLLICRTRNFTIRDNNIVFENEVKKYYEHFLKTAPENIKNQYKKILDAYFHIEQEGDNNPNINKNNKKNDDNIVWWAIGWILFFPAPLTILIWRTKWPKSVKIIITILLWFIIFKVFYRSSK